ncbi:MAG: transcription termination/antitermination protein NusG [Puniceicoccaceae bacterium]
MEEIRENSRESWYVLKTQPKREHLAARQIRDRVGIEVFAPRVSYSKKTVRGKRKFTEALFPGYIFCRCEIEVEMRFLMSIQGVQGLVRYGGDIPSIRDEVVELLREQVPEEEYERPDPVIEVGQRVLVVEGPLKNLQAVVSEVMAAGERIKILLDFLGHEREIAVPREGVVLEDFEPKDIFRKTRDE